MTLPASDNEYLADRRIHHELSSDSGMTCLTFPEWPLPVGFDRASTDLLLRLPAGYPDVPPDMWWCEPAVQRADGQIIPATGVSENYLGRQWQRWSRHFQAGQWRSGIDGLESFIALIRSEFQKSVPGGNP